MNYKHEATGHENKYIGVVWPSCGLIPWELVMSQLDDGHLHSIVDVGKPISLVVYSELEYSKSPGSFQLVGVSWRVLVWLLKGHLVIWVKHCKLELNVRGNKWNPLTSLLLIDVNEVLDVNLSLVVLGVAAIPLVSHLVMAHVVHFQNTSLHKVPFHHFGAQDEVWGALDC